MRISAQIADFASFFGMGSRYPSSARRGGRLPRSLFDLLWFFPAPIEKSPRQVTQVRGERLGVRLRLRTPQLVPDSP